jgi:hypothetical protein
LILLQYFSQTRKAIFPTSSTYISESIKRSCFGRLCIAAFGTYESIRRGGGSKSPVALAGYFALGALVYHLMPRRLSRFFGDTTALLLRKPEHRF